MKQQTGFGIGKVFSIPSEHRLVRHSSLSDGGTRNTLTALTALLLLAGLAPRAEAGIFATGGTVTNYTTGTAPNQTNWTAHIFTSTAWSNSVTTNLNVMAASPGDWVEVLVVGGGGGGGDRRYYY